MNGADIKRFQYIDDNLSICGSKLNIFNNAPDNINCLLINLEKDIDRYTRSVKELNLLSISNFIHIKGTYWKDKAKLETDLNFVVTNIKNIQSSISQSIYIDYFSEISDPNIYIQDGPLGCYISHLRAMLYGYKNIDIDNKSDYIIICEDDIIIKDVCKIELWAETVPSDWDIICFNSIPKMDMDTDNVDISYYKFTADIPFHSTHFYMIKKSILEFVIKNMYPITEQVDVLISNLRDRINIYNIPNTVYQRSVSTNTQNNLHTIFTSNNYLYIRNSLYKIKNEIGNILDIDMKYNKYNKDIETLIFDDIIYNYILHYDKYDNDSKTDGTNNGYIENKVLYKEIAFVMECCRKGINIEHVTNGLICNIYNTIKGFKYHNKVDPIYNKLYKAYSYGSSSYVYMLEDSDIIVKIYNDRLRWSIIGHDNIENIYNREYQILDRLNDNIDGNIDGNIERSIYMKYKGESLYTNFVLPYNYIEQINRIFDTFDREHIIYREFKLENILVYKDIISFVDYGLAYISYIGENNNINRENFIDLLTVLNMKFKNIKNTNHIIILYKTFINNIKLSSNRYSVNIF